MSDNIPIELVEEIIKRLPVKSLLQWRSVSKACKSLIDSSRFMAAHTHSQSHAHRRLLVSYETPTACLRRFVSFADDDTFPHHKFSPTIPVSRDGRRHLKVIGTSLGLFCLQQVSIGRNQGPDMAVIWNPSIRKSVAIPIMDFRVFYDTILGFGVCPDTLDPKIVKIIEPYTKPHSKTDVTWKVEVYALSSRKWRSLRSASCNLPRNTVTHLPSQVVIERFIYWLACKNSVTNDDRYHKQIISFDVSNERFGEVQLPDWLEGHARSIFKLRESLAVVEVTNDMDGHDVWVMDRRKSFTKLFSIKAPRQTRTLGSRRCGEPILETWHKYGDGVGFRSELAVYKLNSEYMNGLGIHAESRTFSVNSYTETLLLLHTGTRNRNTERNFGLVLDCILQLFGCVFSM